MNRIGGVDGCPGGWLRVERTADNSLVAKVLSTERLLAEAVQFAVLTIDIPIGLPDTGPREVDQIARRKLGAGRGRSVFPTPVRAALSAQNYRHACELSYDASKKRLSQQAFAILPKIRQVDTLLQQMPGLIGRVREVHPELSFYFLNGERPMVHAKKTAAGESERTVLLEAHFGEAVREIRSTLPRQSVSTDDILDALAALWSAERVHAGTYHYLPAIPVCDSRGIPMEMVA